MTGVAILGTGEMGTALARALVRGGVEVTAGARDPRRVHPLSGVVVTSLDAAIAAAEVVILAVPYAIARELCPRLAGRIVIDPTTPWDAEIPTSSGSEELARLLPAGAALAGGWKTTFALELELPTETPGDVLFCTDDAEARACTADLIARTGYRALDCGPLAQARVLEGMCRMMGPIARAAGVDVPAVRFAGA